MIDKRALEEIVREVVKETMAKDIIGTATPPAEPCDDVCEPRDHALQKPVDPIEARRVVDATPARVVQGRTGTRYLTSTYLELRAEHAIALDAVRSSVPDGWAEKNG